MHNANRANCLRVHKVLPSSRYHMKRYTTIFPHNFQTVHGTAITSQRLHDSTLTQLSNGTRHYLQPYATRYTGLTRYTTLLKPSVARVPQYPPSQGGNCHALRSPVTPRVTEGDIISENKCKCFGDLTYFGWQIKRGTPRQRGCCSPC